MFDLVPFGKRERDLMRGFFGKDMMDGFFNNDVFFASHSGIRADIKENDKEYIVDAEIPGVDKESIEVELKDNYLTISANHNEEVNVEKENYIRRERKVGRISRSFYVENVKNEEVKASYNNGILNLILPKSKEQKPKGYKIDIN